MSEAKMTLGQAAAWCGGTVAPELAEKPFRGANFDSRRVRSGELFIAITGARDGHDFAASALEKGAAAVVASRPVEGPAIYVTDTVSALQDIARGYRETLSCRCVGITGSVGKTTTKEMIAAVLSTALRTEKTAANFNNGLGLPVTVLGLRPDCQAAVLEMGMNHFGELSRLTAIAQPDIAVITNIGTMHIENLGSREGILRAKLELLEGLRSGGTVIFNGDDALLRPVAERYGAICFGFSPDCQVRAMEPETLPEGQRFPVRAFGETFAVELPAAGRHNVYNALAAVAVGLCCGLTPEQICSGLREFRNTGMRQAILNMQGVTVIEDCYNAGPESMEAALKVLAQTPAAGKRYAVLGGMLELGSYAPERHEAVGRIAAGCADALLAYGAHSEGYVAGAKAAGLADAAWYPSHEAMAQALLSRAEPGDALLFKGSRGMRMERVLELFRQGMENKRKNGG